jgi:transposase
MCPTKLGCKVRQFVKPPLRTLPSGDVLFSVHRLGMSPELRSALEPLLTALESVSEQIREYNQRIEALAEKRYPRTALLKQVKGVGTLIALTFMLTLEDPHRFGKSRDGAAIWACSRDDGTRGKASRRCTSARKAIRICARCWCRERNISWDRSGWTAISGAGG